MLHHHLPVWADISRVQWLLDMEANCESHHFSQGFIKILASIHQQFHLQSPHFHDWGASFWSQGGTSLKSFDWLPQLERSTLSLCLSEPKSTKHTLMWHADMMLVSTSQNSQAITEHPKNINKPQFRMASYSLMCSGSFAPDEYDQVHPLLWWCRSHLIWQTCFSWVCLRIEDYSGPHMRRYPQMPWFHPKHQFQSLHLKKKCTKTSLQCSGLLRSWVQSVRAVCRYEVWSCLSPFYCK